MAKITRDTHDDTTNRKKVIEQLGVPVIDNETNELQDILMTELVEDTHAVFSATRATDTAAGSMRFPHAIGNDWKPYASSTPTIFLTAGTSFIDGYRLSLTTDYDLVANGGLTFPVVGVSDVYGYVYADVVLAEVNSTTDPTMATPLIGETTTRLVLSATFRKVESTVDFETAVAAAAALPVVTNPRLWKYNTARVWCLRYQRPAGTTNITTSMLVDLRQVSPTERAFKQKFVATYRKNQLTGQDGMTVWNAEQSKLQIGSLLVSGDAHNGLIVRQPSAPDHLVSNSVNVVASQYGTGNADAPVQLPDWSKGWSIPDGSALGWSSQGPTLHNNFLLTKGDPTTAAYDTLSATGYTVSPLSAQKLIVQTLASFQADPGSFVLVARYQNDLLWADGHTTRGASASAVVTPQYPAFDTPGESPSSWRAVVAADGNATGPGSNHLTGTDALERALNFSSAVAGSVGSRLHGAGIARNVRYFLRGARGTGVFLFGRGIKRWGDTSEVIGTGGSSIVLIGEEATGGQKATLSLTNPETVSRAIADTAVCQLIASRVVLKDLRFIQDALNATFLAGYVLYIEADTVELDQCDFDSGVYIKADKIRIRDCRFGNSQHVSFTSLVPQLVAKPRVATHLYMTPKGNADAEGTTKKIKWIVRDCEFKTYQTTGFGGASETQHFSGHAAVVLGLTTDGYCNIEDNIFDGVAGQQNLPSIDIAGTLASLRIRGNRFFGAVGISKAGADSAVHASPFNGFYDGCPLFQQGGTGPIVAIGYISSTLGRSITSKTKVDDNFFDLSYMSTLSTASKPYNCFGAMICMFNYVTVGSVANATYANIKYVDNSHAMAQDNSAGYGDGGLGGNVNPGLNAMQQVWTWGFYLAPSVQDGAGLTNVLITDIDVVGNKFDIGDGQTTWRKPWRALMHSNPRLWPAKPNGADSFGWVTDPSCMIGVMLRNLPLMGVPHTGRMGVNINISKNKVTSRPFSGTAGFQAPATIACDATIYPRWFSIQVILTAGDLYAGSNPTLSGNDPSSGNSLFYAQVDHNVCDASQFTTAVDPTAVGAGFKMAAIVCSTGFMTCVRNNIVRQAAGNSFGMGINLLNTDVTQNIRSLVAGNCVSAAMGIGASSVAGSDFISGNLCQTTVVFGGLAADKNFVRDATTGDNFLG